MRLLRADSKFFLLLLVIAGIFLNSCKKKDTDDECPNCPTVTAISPTSAHGFDQLTITGNNFSSDPQSNIVKLTVFQIDLIQYWSGSTSELIVKVPRLCGSGKVTVDVDARTHKFWNSA
ncbi:MAG: IPT/TIG domain-containing protein [Bacteroidetes bacterium]|nr:IPT/TIG domain-containing protein [Bacteroidota bacterium]